MPLSAQAPIIVPGDSSQKRGGGSGWLARAKRPLMKWHLRQWRPLDEPQVESEERSARAEARWTAARWIAGEDAEAWAPRFLAAVEAGLSDPAERAAGSSRAWGWPIVAGACAVAAMAVESRRLDAIFFKAGDLVREGEAGARAAHCMRGWSGQRSQPRSIERAKWISICGQDSDWLRGVFEGWSAEDAWPGKAPILALVAGLLPAVFAWSWVRASRRAFRQPAKGRLASRRMGESARATARDAIQWLDGAGGRMASKGGADAVWHWSWAGLTARGSEGPQAAAWLGAAAAAALPPKERAMAAACWFEGLCSALAQPGGEAFLSQDREGSKGALLAAMRGSRAEPGGLAARMLAAGFASPGALAFFLGYSGLSGAGAGGRQASEAIFAIWGALHRGPGAWAALVQSSSRPLAVYMAERIPPQAGQALRAEVGQALAANPQVPDLAPWAEESGRSGRHGAGLALLSKSDPLIAAFDAAREAQSLGQALGIPPDPAPAGSPADRGKPRRL